MTDIANIPATSSEVLTQDLGFLLARASAFSNAIGNAALSEYGLKVRSYSVLALAAGESEPSQREIAEFLTLDPSQVVALVDQLQRAGLVVREPDPRDRRANVIVATPKGESVFTAAQQSMADANRSHYANLTEQQQQTLASLLREAAFPA